MKPLPPRIAVDRSFRSAAAPTRRGYTLIELMIVVLVLSVLASIMITRFEPTVSDQLNSVARVVADDIGFVRTLAVMNSSEYQLAFSAAGNSYTLTHVGSSSSFDALPDCPFGQVDDPTTQRTMLLSEIPHIGPTVEVVGVAVGSAATASTGSVVFDGLGGLSTGQQTTIWLAAGTGANRRFLAVRVNGVTGLVRVGDIQNSTID